MTAATVERRTCFNFLFCGQAVPLANKYALKIHVAFLLIILQTVDIEFLSVAVDRLGRIADRLGLQRVAKNVPTLAQYLDAVAEQKASSDADAATPDAISDEEDEVVSVKRSAHT
jgi:hypothetical protein